MYTEVSALVGRLGFLDHLRKILVELIVPLHQLIDKHDSKPHTKNVLPWIFNKEKAPERNLITPKTIIKPQTQPSGRKEREREEGLRTPHQGELAQSVGVYLGAEAQKDTYRRRCRRHLRSSDLFLAVLLSVKSLPQRSKQLGILRAYK